MSASPEEIEFHNRLLDGDVTVSSEIISRFLGPTVITLGRKFPETRRRDETLILDAVTDAILNYISSPEKYAPERMRLSSYLLMSARGDLLNRLERQRRRSILRKLLGIEV